MGKNFLVISDLQTPYEHPGALRFCQQLRKEFKVAHENIYCVGDETDQYWASLFKKSIEADLTALQELALTKEHLKPWYKTFPKMKLAQSNHGIRWRKKALDAEIPSQLLKRYEEIIEAPKNWVWQQRWHVKCKYPFIVEHGDDFGGQYPHVQAATTNHLSTVIGHFHTTAGVEYINTKGTDRKRQLLWGACAGSLIDFEKFAFDYARKSKRRPVLGSVVVLDDGKTPVFVPMT